MPTVLYVQGWRLCSYTNEGNEPMRVHVLKGTRSAGIGCSPERFDILEEYQYNCGPRLRREIRQIIFEHFDQIVIAWREHFGEAQCRVKQSRF